METVPKAQKTITYTAASGDDPQMWEASHGDNPGRTYGKRDQCGKCGLEYPVAKMRYFRGTAYGMPCGCYTDIYQVIRDERRGSSRQAKPEEGEAQY